MTVTISIPDELFAKLSALPSKERKHHVAELTEGKNATRIHENILEALAEAELANRFATPEEDRADLIASLREADADIAAGRTVSLAEESARRKARQAELMARGSQ